MNVTRCTRVIVIQLSDFEFSWCEWQRHGEQPTLILKHTCTAVFLQLSSLPHGFIKAQTCVNQLCGRIKHVKWVQNLRKKCPRMRTWREANVLHKFHGKQNEADSQVDRLPYQATSQIKQTHQNTALPPITQSYHNNTSMLGKLTLVHWFPHPFPTMPWLTIASHHLSHTRYSANSQIVVCRVIYLGLCGYILQEEPYSKQCTKADLPMMIHCWDMMATMWDFSCLGMFANPAQYGKTSHPSLHWQIGDGYGPPQTFDPLLQFSGLTVYKDRNLHCLGFEWPTTWVFSKLHPFLENTHSRHNTKHNIM